MLRLISGALAIIIGAVIGLLAATGGPAGAVRPTSVEVECLGADGYRVNWIVDNSGSDLDVTVETSSNAAVVVPGSVVPGRTSAVFGQQVAVPQQLTLVVELVWSDGERATVSESVAEHDFPVHCGPNAVPVTLCHATPPDSAASGWHAITIDDDAVVKQGHGYEHAADIIPAFSYWVLTDAGWTRQDFPGLNLGTSFSGVSGQAILDAGCVLPSGPIMVTPVAAARPQECVDNLLVDGFVDVTPTPGIHYTLRNASGDIVPLDPTTGTSRPVPPGEYLVEVSAAPGYELSTAGPLAVTVVAFDGPCGDIPTEPLVVPLVASVQATCTTLASYTLADDLGLPGSVVWSVNEDAVVEATYRVNPPARVTIVATPASGYGFAEDTRSNWVLDFLEPSGCELQTLAPTGVGGRIGWLAFATLLFAVGAVLLAAEGRARWRVARAEPGADEER